MAIIRSPIPQAEIRMPYNLFSKSATHDLHPSLYQSSRAQYTYLDRAGLPISKARPAIAIEKDQVDIHLAAHVKHHKEARD